MQSVITIRKKDWEVMKKDPTEEKLRNKIRRVYEEDDYFVDKYCVFKRAICQGDKDEDLVVTCDHIKSKRRILHLVQRVRK